MWALRWACSRVNSLSSRALRAGLARRDRRPPAGEKRLVRGATDSCTESGARQIPLRRVRPPWSSSPARQAALLLTLAHRLRIWLFMSMMTAKLSGGAGRDCASKLNEAMFFSRSASLPDRLSFSPAALVARDRSDRVASSRCPRARRCGSARQTAPRS